MTIIKIITNYVNVYCAPDVFSTIICHLKTGVFITTETRLSEKNSTFWIKISSGYIQSHDQILTKNYQISNFIEANSCWFQEESKRQRMASAISSMLIKSFPLQKAKRFARALLTHAHTFYPNPNRPITSVLLGSSEQLSHTNSTANLPPTVVDSTADDITDPNTNSKKNGKNKSRHAESNITPLVIHSPLAIEDIMILLKGKCGVLICCYDLLCV